MREVIEHLSPAIAPISPPTESLAESDGPMVHPTAQVDRSAVIGKGVWIGPYCIVDGNAVIGDGCRLVAHVHVTGDTTIGARTIVYPFASLGTPPQSSHYRGGRTRLTIGAGCDIRESVTMNTGYRGRRRDDDDWRPLLLHGQ